MARNGKRRRRPAWSLAEERTLVKEHALHGNTWQRIANSLPGRSVGEVKNIYHSTLRSTGSRKRSLLRAYVTAVRGHEADPEARSQALREVEAAHRDSHRPQPQPQPQPQLLHLPSNKGRPSSPPSAHISPSGPGAGMDTAVATAQLASTSNSLPRQRVTAWRQQLVDTESEAPAVPLSNEYCAGGLRGPSPAGSTMATAEPSTTSPAAAEMMPTKADFLRIRTTTAGITVEGVGMHPYPVGTHGPEGTAAWPEGRHEPAAIPVNVRAQQQCKMPQREGFLLPRLLPLQPQPLAGAALGSESLQDQQRLALPAAADGGPIVGDSTGCPLKRRLLSTLDHYGWPPPHVRLQQQQQQQGNPGPAVVEGDTSELQDTRQLPQPAFWPSAPGPGGCSAAGRFSPILADAAANQTPWAGARDPGAATAAATAAPVASPRGPVDPSGVPAVASCGTAPLAAGSRTAVGTPTDSSSTSGRSLLEVLFYLYGVCPVAPSAPASSLSR